MKDVLADIVKQSMGVTTMLRVIGTNKSTIIKGAHESNTLFIEGELKQPIPEFVGEFGLSNLGLLKGLLDFASYRTDKATFRVKRMKTEDGETVEQLQFRDEHGVGSDYRATSPRALPTHPTIPNIPWDVTLIPSRSKLAEFSKLASLFKEIANFGVRTENGNLLLTFGSSNDASNHGEMVFETGVSGMMRGNVVWTTSAFSQVMSLVADRDATLRFTNKGVIGVQVETDHATYRYYLRGMTAV
jgi:hypothetical protein